LHPYNISITFSISFVDPKKPQNYFLCALCFWHRINIWLSLWHWLHYTSMPGLYMYYKLLESVDIITYLHCFPFKGVPFFLEDCQSTVSQSEALMWARVCPFSPLATGTRMNPFWWPTVSRPCPRLRPLFGPVSAPSLPWRRAPGWTPSDDWDDRGDTNMLLIIKTSIYLNYFDTFQKIIIINL